MAQVLMVGASTALISTHGGGFPVPRVVSYMSIQEIPKHEALAFLLDCGNMSVMNHEPLDIPFQ